MMGECHCKAVRWRLDTPPESVTACNCSVCSRYGVLWAYGYLGHDIFVTGDTATYCRRDDGVIDFHFCKKCACVSHYVSRKPDSAGKSWTAVNLRLTDPVPIAHLPIDHFDGLDSFDDLPRDGRCVGDMWF